MAAAAACSLALLTPTNLSIYRRRVLAIPTTGRHGDQPWPAVHSLTCLPLRHPSSRPFSLVRATGDGDAAESQPSSAPSPPEVAFRMKMPSRRSLLVEFTCDSCGERTEHLINRAAYDKGTIFLQCAECLAHHKFVDNLGLVVENDPREELKQDSDVPKRRQLNKKKLGKKHPAATKEMPKKGRIFCLYVLLGTDDKVCTFEKHWNHEELPCDQLLSVLLLILT